MKNKKGFTLIELLAVIVILAIIALIATPIVLNMINNARKKAAESSAYGFIDAIEYNNGFAQTEQPGYTEINGENLDATSIDVKMKGKKPTSGIVTIENGKVTSANLCVEGYTVVYNGREVTKVDKGCNGSSSSEETTPTPTSTFGGEISLEASNSTKTYKGIAYLNPTDLTATCTSSTAVSTTGTNTGCMKFYIFDDSNNQYKMILDHNTSGNVAWNSSGNNSDGMNEVATRLSEDTTGWTGSPRLIKADEVAHIVGADSNDTIKWKQSNTYGTDDTTNKASWFNLDGSGTTYSSSDGWQKQVATTPGSSKYAWLYDYTYQCTGGSTEYGCNIADDNKYPYGTKDSTNTNYINGYWTQDAVVGDSSGAWRVLRIGYLGSRDVGNADYYGVRPVITLSKSDVQ